MTSPKTSRRSCATCSGSSDRGEQIQRASARRPQHRAFNPDLAGRPQLIQGNTQLLFRGMGRLTENSVIAIKNKSYS